MRSDNDHQDQERRARQNAQTATYAPIYGNDAGQRGSDTLAPRSEQRVTGEQGDNPALQQQPRGLSQDSDARKTMPIYMGAMMYFPDALAEVSGLSFRANEKHNPGEEMHWSKGKSNDHGDCLVRHLLCAGEWDEDNKCSHTVAVAWRALALLQTEIEEARENG